MKISWPQSLRSRMSWIRVPKRPFMTSFLVLIGLVLLATSVYWDTRFPYTHDGENHLVRLVNYAAAVREGQWPPRFAPYILNGYGFPVFTFNYPLGNILGLPFGLLKLNPEYTFRIQVVAALLAGTGSMYWWLNQTEWRRSRWFAVILYLSSAYGASLLVHRGSLGEIWAYGLAPVLGALFWQARQKRQWRWWLLASLGVTATLLAHNLFGLMLAGIWLALSLFLAGRRYWQQWLVSWGLGVGMSLWFWLPAITELPLIVLQEDSLATQASDHLLRWSQILFSPLQFGFSRSGPLDTLGFGLGGVSLIVLLLALASSLRTLTTWIVTRRRPSWWALGGVTVSVFIVFTLWMSSSQSQVLWEVFTPLQILQFPWRWLMLATLLIVMAGAWIYASSTRWVRVLLWGLLVIQTVSVWSLQPADRFHRDYQTYLTSPTTTLTRNENRPRTLTQDVPNSWSPTPSILEGQGKVTSITRWNGSHHVYTLEVATDVVVSEPTVYYPGWTVTADGESVLVEPQLAQGLVAYRLAAQPGEQTAPTYQIVTRFRETSWGRRVGNTLSLLSAFAWGGLFIRLKTPTNSGRKT